ncbi:hypothetical protein OG539_35365 [Actinacidiphila glaucinigra]|uniref:hypothetical protein n=1 Tax=Actinacidiphila glaucinigra TaxID=235986 RepID=UPI003255E285
MPGSPGPAAVTRPARPADLPHLLRWERDCIRTAEPAAAAANLALRVECLDRALVLEADGEPGGSMMWTPTDTGTARTARTARRR